jgi:magnesium-transporting ATPase (P-type)
MCLNFFLILFIGYTSTADKLSIQKPRNSLFSVTNIAQIIIMFILQFFGQICSVLLFKYTNPLYYSEFGGFDNSLVAYHKNENTFNLAGVEGNAVFIFVNNVYIASVLAFNISNPWRKEVFTNIPLIIVTILTFAYNTALALIPESRMYLF